MRFYEFTIPKPPTPEQAKINTLKQQKERALKALKTEKIDRSGLRHWQA